MTIDSLGLLIQYVWLNLRAEMQFRVNFAGTIVALTISTILAALVAVVIINWFGNANGWEAGQIIFLYGLWRIQHGVLYFVASAAQRLDRLILEGHMDRFLVRPRSVMLQIAGISHLTVTGIGNILGGTSLAIYGLTVSPIAWSPWLGLWLVVVMMSGTTIQIGMFFLMGALPLFRVRIDDSIVEIDRTQWQMTLFPLSVYSLAVQVLLTFVLPWGFVVFYPGHLLYERSSDIVFGSPLVYLAPVVATLVSSVAWVVWRAGLRNYQGAGA